LVGNITTRARTKSLIYMNKINFLKWKYE
jgi:hypothetical protein